MKNHLRVSVLIVAVLATALLANVTPVLAAGLGVSPKLGGYDATFSVTGSGFNANEKVSTWVTLSNGSTVSLGQLTASSTGSIAFTVTPSSSWASGEVIAVAHGMSSQRESFVKFTLLQAPSEPTNSTSSSGVTYVGSYSGLTLYYQGSGYQAGERVIAWFHYPGDIAAGIAHPLPDAYADASGNVSFPFTVQKSWPYGGYHISVQGTLSKHITYNTFSWFGAITDQRSYWYNAGVTGTSTGQWTGYYFANSALAGSPVLTRVDSAINFNWGVGSPAGGIPADSFSVRWVSSRYFSSAGNYVFTATADDGVRVWVDGNLIIDEWQDQVATTYSATVYLSKGYHTVVVEYYENMYNALISVGIAAQ